ncbi:hypothetical protein GC163_04570 [bacterium]|nr:hypothetical protein [bacterium]
MARRQQQSTTVELFPFLAVLVCVMGALIFLLLVMTKRLRAAAVAKAQAAVTQAYDDRPILPELVEDDVEDFAPSPAVLSPDLAAVPIDEPVGWSAAPAVKKPEEPAVDRQAHYAALDALQQQWTTKVASLEADVDQRQAALNRQRLLLMTTERQTTELKQQLLQKETELAAMMGRISATQGSQSATSAEQAKLERVIQQLRQQLKQLAEQQEAASSQYAIVPYDGKSGTTRRPILIECTATGLKFLPEDVTLTPADIEGFTPRFNPLLSGAAALTSYWSQQPPSSGDAPAEPYVLLIVRPDGTLAYYIAMKLLSGMKQPHGYELVTDDMSLQLSPIDPNAKAALEAAIEQTLAERQRMVQAMSSGTGLGRGNGGGQGTGNEVGGGSGFGSGRGGRDSSTYNGGGSGGRLGGADAAPKGNSRGEFALSDIEDSEQVGNRSWEDVDRFEGQEFRKRRESGGSTGGTNSQSAPNGTSQNRSQGSPSASVTGQGSQSPRSDTTSEATAKSSTGRPPTTGQPASNNGQWQPRSGSTGGQTAGSSGSSATGSPDESEEDYPNFNQSASRRKGQAAKSLPYEHLQQRKWGPHEPGATIGLEKPVRVRVEAERMVIEQTLAIPVTAGASREQLFNQLLSAVDQQSQGWGQPGSGFFWVPSLRFEVLPGGNTAYERVVPLVSKCGLSHRTEYSLGQTAAELPEAKR